MIKKLLKEKTKAFTADELEYLFCWIKVANTDRGYMAGLSVRKSAQLLGRSETWVSDHIKSGDIIAGRLLIGYCIPIEELIRLKKGIESEAEA